MAPAALAPDAFDAPMQCEREQLQAVPVPWACAAAGDVDLGVLLAAGGCRVGLEAPGYLEERGCARGLSARVSFERARAGHAVTLHVAVTNALGETRMMDVDPFRAPEVYATAVDAPPPRSRSAVLCLVAGGDPNEPSGPERVRLVLAPGATLHFDAVWRATWTDYVGPRCVPEVRPLPPGRYRLAIVGPVLVREPFETEIDLR
jgi:hypothetical protein